MKCQSFDHLIFILRGQWLMGTYVLIYFHKININLNTLVRPKDTKRGKLDMLKFEKDGGYCQ